MTQQILLARMSALSQVTRAPLRARAAREHSVAPKNLPSRRWCSDLLFSAPLHAISTRGKRAEHECWARSLPRLPSDPASLRPDPPGGFFADSTTRQHGMGTDHGGSLGGSLLGGGSVSGDPKAPGKAVGVGLHLARGPHGEVIVKDVKIGGAAAAAGVQPNSIIHSVNGQMVSGMDVRQVRDQILGESGSKITFHLQPPGSQHVEVLSLVRDAARGVHGVPASLIRKDSIRAAALQHRPQLGEIQLRYQCLLPRRTASKIAHGHGEMI